MTEWLPFLSLKKSRRATWWCLIEEIEPFSLFRTVSKCGGGKPLLSFITRLRPFPPFMATQPGRGKKGGGGCFIKTFIKVVNFGTINNSGSEKSICLRKLQQGGIKIRVCHSGTQSRCDLPYSIEIADDWQRGAASIFHGLLRRMMMMKW